jgi:hypothetical protein
MNTSACICRDLGVTPDWSLWQDEAWAIEARGAQPALRPERELAQPQRDPPFPCHPGIGEADVRDP